MKSYIGYRLSVIGLLVVLFPMFGNAEQGPGFRLTGTLTNGNLIVVTGPRSGADSGIPADSVADTSSVAQVAADLATETNRAVQAEATKANAIQITAMSDPNYSNALHYIVWGQSFAVGMVTEGYGFLPSYYLTGITNCFENVHTFEWDGVVNHDYTGQMKIGDDLTRWSAQISCSKILSDVKQAQIYVTRTGRNGRNLACFLPGAPEALYEDLTNEVSITKLTWTNAPDPSFIVHLQGQSDLAGPTTNYYEMLTEIYENNLRVLYPNIKLILYGDNRYYLENAYDGYVYINGEKRRFAENHDWAFYVDGLEDPYGDNHHPNVLGNIVMGAKLASTALGFSADQRVSNGIYAETLRAYYLGAASASIGMLNSAHLSANLIDTMKLTAGSIVATNGIDDMSYELSAIGLSRYLPFENTVSDLVTTNTYSVEGVVGLSVDTNRNSSVAVFSGATNNYITCDNPINVTSNFSISVWAKLNTGFTNLVNYGLCGTYGNSFGSNVIVHLRTYGSDTTFVCSFRGNTDEYETFTCPVGYLNGTKVSYSDYPFSDWRHYAVAISSNTARLYVNGQLASTVTSVKSPAGFDRTASTIQHIGIGASAGWYGPIDEFMVFTNTISARDAYSLYQNQRKNKTGIRGF